MPEPTSRWTLKWVNINFSPATPSMLVLNHRIHISVIQCVSVPPTIIYSQLQFGVMDPNETIEPRPGIYWAGSFIPTHLELNPRLLRFSIFIIDINVHVPVCVEPGKGSTNVPGTNRASSSDARSTAIMPLSLLSSLLFVASYVSLARF